MVYKMRYRSQHPYSIKEKQMKSEVLSVKEKIGYGMGDAASHIIFDNVMLYMMFFYTDIFGIPAGFVGTMIFGRSCTGCDFRSLHGVVGRSNALSLG